MTETNAPLPGLDTDASGADADAERASTAGGADASAEVALDGDADGAGPDRPADSGADGGDADSSDQDDEDQDDEDEDEEDEDEEDEDEDDEEQDEEAGTGGRRSPSDAELFAQSEVAADYIEGLLDVLDMDGDIDEVVSGGRPVVEVVGGRLQALVGPRGATLEALQELTRLAVFRQTGAPSRLLLDVGGFRASRRKELAAVARTAVAKVRDSGEPLRLEPMSAFERKCVHDVVNAADGVQSESEGVEPHRRIVVRPA